MSRPRIYVETNRNGNSQFIRTRRGSIRMSTLDMLHEAEDRIDVLTAENHSLSHHLNAAKDSQYSLESRYRSLINEHNGCRSVRDQLQVKVQEAASLRRRLEDEQDRNARLSAEVRRLGGTGNYRQRYEDKLVEVVDLKRRLAQSDDVVRQKDRKVADLRNEIIVKDERISRRDKTIASMKRLLSQLGYAYVERGD